MTEEERSVILAGLAELECKICANDLVVGEDRVCDGCLGAIASDKIDKLDARIFDLQNNVQQRAERIKELENDLLNSKAEYEILRRKKDDVAFDNAQLAQRVKMLEKALSRYAGVRDGYGDYSANQALAAKEPE